MMTEENIVSLIDQARQIDPTCYNYDDFIFLTNELLSDNAQKNKGWKLHISVDIEDVERTFQLIAKVIYEHFYRFKVIDIEHKFSERFTKGTQFTIPLVEDDENKPDLDVAHFIEQIDSILSSNGIRPGVRPVSDAPIKISPYFSIRNSCLIFGEHVIDAYLDSDQVAHFYNPALRANPYAHLISEDCLSNPNFVEYCKELLNTPEISTNISIDIIKFSLMHRYLNLNKINPHQEAFNTFIESLKSGDFSYLDAHNLWHEGQKSDEACKTLQAIAIFIKYNNKHWFEEVSYSNRCLGGELSEIFKLIDQKKSPARHKPRYLMNESIDFEKYYLNTIHFQNYKIVQRHVTAQGEINEQQLCSKILNLIHAISSYVQQMEQMNKEWYEEFETYLQILSEFKIPSEHAEWFANELNAINKNNFTIQLMVISPWSDFRLEHFPVKRTLENVNLALHLLRQLNHPQINDNLIDTEKKLKKRTDLLDKDDSSQLSINNDPGEISIPASSLSAPGELSIFHSECASSSSNNADVITKHKP